MEYRRLGRAGIQLGELAYGSWLTFNEGGGVDMARACMRAAHDAGMNFFDNAEVYGDGLAERIMGQALEDFRREDLVISTKIFWGGKGPNDTGLSWKHLLEGTKNSLYRLGLDYVDLLYCHRPDPDTPVEETVRAMDVVVRQGLAFYWGTSEWPKEAILEAYEVAARFNCIPPAMEQPQYNLFHRQRVEEEYAPLFEGHRMGATIWSPLASGILTGKYQEGIPKGSRLQQEGWLAEGLTSEKRSAVERLQRVAAELACSLPQLCIAWCLKNPNVTSVITGATTVKQLQENLGALEVKEHLTDDVMARVAEAARLSPSS